MPKVSKIPDPQIECGEPQGAPWFVQRMSRQGHFGLMISTGTIIGITRIKNVHQLEDGSAWVDVELTGTDKPYKWNNMTDIAFVPPPTHTVSINARHIVAAFVGYDS